MARLLARVLVIALATLWLAGCAAPRGGPLAWIDAPLQGSTLPLGPVEVVSHTNYPDGVGRVELSVAGIVAATADGAGQTLAVTHQLWQPDAPGTYVLRVRAMSVGGVWGDYARADVTIREGEPEASPTATPRTLAEDTATPTPSTTPTATPEPPTATPVPPTGTPEPPTATPVPPTATPVPPTATPVPSGPAIGQPNLSGDRFYWGSCPPAQVTFTVQVSDPAGVASVQVHFRRVDKATGSTGEWGVQSMASGRVGWYVTVAAPEVPGYNQSSDAWVEFYFVATDKERRTTTSPPYRNRLTLAYCTIVR